MTFEDLDDDWDEESLYDADLAIDVVDLLLGDSDRRRNSALLLLCDEDGFLLQPSVISDIDWRMTAAKRAELFRFIAELGFPGVVVAISAAQAIDPAVVERWRRTAVRELRKELVDLIGFYCADPDEVWDAFFAAA